MKNKIFITNSYSETQKIGEDFSKEIKERIVALHGELGSGKTTFVQGLAKGLGIKQRIISPTFMIIRSYEIASNNTNAKNLYHLDLYRIDNENDIVGMEFEEILKNPENIVVIEWPEKLKKLLPKEKANIFFEYLDENKRRVEFK